MKSEVQPHATVIVQAIAPNRWALAWHFQAALDDAFPQAREQGVLVDVSTSSDKKGKVKGPSSEYQCNSAMQVFARLKVREG